MTTILTYIKEQGLHRNTCNNQERLEYIKKHPGCTSKDIAKEFNLTPRAALHWIKRQELKGNVTVSVSMMVPGYRGGRSPCRAYLVGGDSNE